MKIVIIGGHGRIGSKVGKLLRADGYDAVAADLDTGIDTLTGQGLDEALEGADVVIDVSNSPAFDEASATSFFETATRNVLAAEEAAGVRHHVALSVVGTDRPNDIGYFHAKAAQEKLIREGGVPYSIVHATQFFEFLEGIISDATDGDTVRLAPVLFQPMAADDVAKAVARVAVGEPLNDVVEIAGPERFRFDELARDLLRERDDPREVIADPEAPYFGAVIGERTLVPGDDARLGEITLDEWRSRASSRPAMATR